MDQKQKDKIYKLIFEKRYSIFNRKEKEEKFMLFLEKNNINFNFKISIKNVIAYLKNIEKKCQIDECDNERIFVGIRNKENFGFNSFCSNNCYKKSISIRQMGENNTSHRMSEETFKNMCRKNSKKMKANIKNGSFTPNITNSWHGSFSYLTIDNKKFRYRSSWEAFFHLCNPKLLYEDIRIEYLFKDISHNYIIDFVDYDEKILYEIKPKSTIGLSKNTTKRRYAEEWCLLNGYEFIYITEDWIIENKEKFIHLLDNQPDGDNIIRKLKRYK